MQNEHLEQIPIVFIMQNQVIMEIIRSVLFWYNSCWLL